MKAVIVLQADHNSFQRHAGEIDGLLSENSLVSLFHGVELWLFHQAMRLKQPSHSHPYHSEKSTGADEIESKRMSIPVFSFDIAVIKQIPVENVHFPETILTSLFHLAHQDNIGLFCFSSDGLGEELATRLSFRLGGSSCLQVERCVANPTLKSFEVTKPVYGNNLSARILLKNPPYCLSPAKQAGSPIQMISPNGKKIEAPIFEQTDPCCPWVTDWVVIPDEADTGLSNADLIVVVGQGVKSKKCLEKVHAIAKSLGAELGASRPVVMNAWTEMNRLVGASGLILSPKCCIAAGVSGTAVFSAGIKNSQFIVAINTDASAPIFHLAHVGIVGDLEAILTELEQFIKHRKGFHPF